MPANCWRLFTSPMRWTASIPIHQSTGNPPAAQADRSSPFASLLVVSATFWFPRLREAGDAAAPLSGLARRTPGMALLMEQALPAGAIFCSGLHPGGISIGMREREARPRRLGPNSGGSRQARAGRVTSSNGSPESCHQQANPALGGMTTTPARGRRNPHLSTELPRYARRPHHSKNGGSPRASPRCRAPSIAGCASSHPGGIGPLATSGDIT